jgi:hypothetical protein
MPSDLADRLRRLGDAGATAGPGAVLERARRRAAPAVRRRRVVAGLVVASLLAVAVLVVERDDEQPNEVAVGDEADERPSSAATITWDVDGNAASVPLRAIPDGVTPSAIGDAPVWVVRSADAITVFVDDAQHLDGEQVWWCPAEQLFAAPTHAERFDIQGRHVDGPAAGGLDRYDAIVMGDVLVVDTATRIVGGNEPGEPADPPPTSSPWDSGPGSFCEGAVRPVVDAPPTASVPDATTGFGPDELEEGLETRGFTVTRGEIVNGTPFAVDSQVWCVSGTTLRVYEYGDAAARSRDSETISSDGYGAGGAMVEWLDTPHFFAADRILVLLLGDRPDVERSLTQVLGPTISPAATGGRGGDEPCDDSTTTDT